MKKITILILSILAVTFTSCDKDTEGVSKVTHYPILEMTGKSFINIVKEDNGAFVDPGVTATLDGNSYPIIVDGWVDITNTNLYVLTYTTHSTEGFPVSTSRMVLVTDELLSDDYSGTYVRYNNGTSRGSMNIDKVTTEIGYYKIANIWIQSTAVPIEFIDLGGGNLQVLTNQCVYGPLTPKNAFVDSEGSLVFEMSLLNGGNTYSWVAKFTK